MESLGQKPSKYCTLTQSLVDRWGGDGDWECVVVSQEGSEMLDQGVKNVSTEDLRSI